jgi:OmpA-OmpF porin, OOP family
VIPASNSAASGFDFSRVPVVNPQLGKFSYVSLIEGYQRGEYGKNKHVAFDRYEFFLGGWEQKANTILTSLKGAYS